MAIKTLTEIIWKAKLDLNLIEFFFNQFVIKFPKFRLRVAMGGRDFLSLGREYHSVHLSSFFHALLHRHVSTRKKRGGGGGGAVAQSVERATPGEEVVGANPAVAARCHRIFRNRTNRNHSDLSWRWWQDFSETFRLILTLAAGYFGTTRIYRNRL